MATESVNAFIKKMNTDNKFADKVLQSVNDACIIVAKEEGIHITAEELNDALDMLND